MANIARALKEGMAQINKNRRERLARLDTLKEDTLMQEQYDYEVQRQQWLEEQETQPNNVRCKCGNPVHPKRVEAGYYWCMDCGETRAKEARTSWCIAPLAKSNYILITDYNDLKGLNPKRTAL